LDSGYYYGDSERTDKWKIRDGAELGKKADRIKNSLAEKRS